MSRDNKHPQAFPYSGEGDDANYSKGMTLRDFFAAKAMHSSLSADTGNSIQAKHHASWAYEMADAMLEERNAK